MLFKRSISCYILPAISLVLVVLGAAWLPQQALAAELVGSPAAPNSTTPIPSEAGMIGLLLEKSPEGFVRVEDVLETGPAYRAGLRIGDVIDRIDGTFAAVLSVREAVARVKGARGSMVVITVEGKGDMRIQRALSLPEVTTGWRQQQIGRLRQQLTMAEARLLKAHQAIAPEFPWVEGAWTKHAATVRGPLSKLIAKTGQSADARGLAIALECRDFGKVARALPLESHFETMVMTPGLQTLPHTFHHLKLSAAILASKHHVEQHEFKKAVEALSLVTFGADYSYSSATGEFDRYNQIIRKLEKSYRQLVWMSEQIRTLRQEIEQESKTSGSF
jgi:membrane-associated protease RseP (regulator of RpoE activity)